MVSVETVFAVGFLSVLALSHVSIHLLVLNHNGRALLAECLPSVVRAAAQSRHPCRVSVVDNASTDDSSDWLADHFPGVAIHRCANRGLCSLNDVVRGLPDRIVVLLNNDIRLADDAIDPLISPLLQPPAAGDSPVWMTAPRAWLFDGTTYEGFRTAVGWRWGLVQATARFEGADDMQQIGGVTAAAGAALAVDRARFVELGGFDPLYLPGRIEDLDLAYRAFQAGYTARYVPESQAWHRGEATFTSSFGASGSRRLALRNTLLFQWKHLRCPRHIARWMLGIPLRVAFDLVRAPWQARAARFTFTRALIEALPRLPSAMKSSYRGPRNANLEREFFARHSVPRLKATALGIDPVQEEKRRWEARHPLSRWYVQPVVNALVWMLSATAVRPWHVTLLGLLFATMACCSLLVDPAANGQAALLMWLAWLCDRLDGPLARVQFTATIAGARLDAAVDEGIDLGLHLAVAAAAAGQHSSILPWLAVATFVFGKGMLLRAMHTAPSMDGPISSTSARLSWWRRLYHLPGNSDVRLHLSLAALATGWLTTELIVIAAYYNLRWIVCWFKSLNPSAAWWPRRAAT